MILVAIFGYFAFFVATLSKNQKLKKNNILVRRLSEIFTPEKKYSKTLSLKNLFLYYCILEHTQQPHYAHELLPDV